MPDYVLEGPKWGASSNYGTYGGIVSWAVDASVPAYVVSFLAQAFANWSQYGNIRFEQVSSVSQSLLDISFGAIDGPSNTLGIASYSYSGNQMLSADIIFDTAENWHQSGQNVVSSGGSSFYIVALHEIGHAIGLDHYEGSTAVMNPFLSPSVTALTQSDINGIVALYGNAAPLAPIVGTSDNDVLVGTNFDDTIIGLAGADQLSGGSGNDQLDGGAGADRLDGGANYDFARYDGSAAGIVIRLDYGMGINGDAQDDQLLNIEGIIGSGNQDFIFGNADANALLGLGGNDWLYGHAGNDELRGGNGTDQLLGGAGADLLHGEGGNDQFWFLASEFQAGVWDYIYDFGESASNFDYLRFEGISASQLIIGDNAGAAVITTTALNYSGGIVIQNFSGVQTLDQLIFA